VTSSLHKHRQFGDGLRACIGRGFAEQEILINMAMTLQKFDMEMVDPDYEMQLRGQMGIKPIGLKMRARRRPGRTLLHGIPGGGSYQEPEKEHQKQSQNQYQQQMNGLSASTETKKKPVSVFFGGNMGTCENLVQSLSRSAPEFGLNVVDIKDLDDAVENLRTDRPSIIITSSYEGRPADNAKKFVTWIEQLKSKGVKLPAGVKFAIFGVGNSDWVHTFHRIPRLIDETLEQLGAERIIEAGFANVKRDLLGPWEAWSEKVYAILGGTTKQEHPGVEVHIESNKLDTLNQVLGGEQLRVGVVVANRQLADSSVGAAKRHVEVRLPAGSEYRSGDYLVVQGRNSDETVLRVMSRFGLSAEDVMSVKSSKKDFLPAQPMAVEHFLRSSVELAAPVTKRQIEILASWAKEGSTERRRLEKMHDDIFYQSLLEKRYSIIDVLEEVPEVQLPFGVYIDLLLPLSPRLYSISSSPLEQKNKSKDGLIASVTFDVFESPATSGHGTFRGVASSYVANRALGDNILCLIRPTKIPFHLPSDPKTPVIMLAAGSGIAPMRAFIEERAAINRAGVQKLGPALLFFGCRHPDKDYLYRDELAAWEGDGVVEVITSFSKPENDQKGQHVPDALWQHRERVWDMFSNGANIYICGSAARLGRSSAAMWRQIWSEKTGKSDLEALEWLDQIKNDRYISDFY
jgi:cytochrome P450/NADPH-cytochrome P450 reductase